METRNPEKCYYCNEPAKYNDLVSDGKFYFVTGVCSKHIKNYVSNT